MAKENTHKNMKHLEKTEWFKAEGYAQVG